MNSGLIGALGAAPLRVTGMTRRIVTSAPNANVNVLQLQATGGSKNVDLMLTPKGSGAFMLGPAPDNTNTGGSKRGQYAVDLQMTRNSPGRLAAGDHSFIAGNANHAIGTGSVALAAENIAGGAYAGVGGYQSTAYGIRAFAWGRGVNGSGTDSVVFGGNSTSNGTGSLAAGEAANANGNHSQAIGISVTVGSGIIGGFARGNLAIADRLGMRAEGNGSFAAQGDAQNVAFIVRNKTTTNSTVELFLDGSTTRLTIPSGKIFSGTVNIVGSKSDGTSVARYLRLVTIKNVAGTTSLVGNVIALGSDEVAGTSISITANDTNDALRINVTGVLSETWRWIATIEGAELAYGA